MFCDTNLYNDFQQKIVQVTTIILDSLLSNFMFWWEVLEPIVALNKQTVWSLNYLHSCVLGWAVYVIRVGDAWCVGEENGVGGSSSGQHQNHNISWKYGPGI